MKRIEFLIISIFLQAFFFICPVQATHREVNGCGDDSGLGRFVPNQPVGVDFRPVCDDHDRCYGTLGQSRERCDNAFRSGLRAKCEKELLRSAGGLLDTVVTGGQALNRCYDIAKIYYQAVRERGGTAYSKAQDHAREELASTPQSIAGNVTESRPVLQLQGNFKGSGMSRANFFDRGNARMVIEVDGRTWYDSGYRSFIYNQTRGRCVVGNFSGSGRSDIACLYDYGNFDVGAVVFVSNGRFFEESIWWRSGPGKFNPDAVEGSLAVIQNSSGKSNIRFTYRYPENVGSVTLVSTGSKFNVVVER